MTLFVVIYSKSSKIDFPTPDKGSNFSIAAGETRGKNDQHVLGFMTLTGSNLFT